MRLEHLLSGETAIRENIMKSGSLEPGASCTRNCLLVYRLGETVVISVRFRNLPSDEIVQEIFDIYIYKQFRVQEALGSSEPDFPISFFS